ncbi:hypothetical protein Lalb_Chr21g0318731 [Lupinus albus]|uniref:Uncharacterized protein n=1 Tax=Lupinus albus TaxID=3870 RepID=A0A6A4N8Z0_LUPAL|nr:hypothetical protein Lalb_Chr21g0318731 [Lupinus albus]
MNCAMMFFSNGSVYGVAVVVIINQITIAFTIVCLMSFLNSMSSLNYFKHHFF